MSEVFQVPAAVPVPVELPPIVWIGDHPTTDAPEPRGTRLRQCVRCGTRELFHSLTCEPGMIVHLIDPADVHGAPGVFDGVPWAEPDAIVGAHDRWTGRGYTITRKPDGPSGEDVHPRYRACPRCNEEGMAAGTVRSLLAPREQPVPRPERRGKHGWARG